jgi:hypothetical protein
VIRLRLNSLIRHFSIGLRYTILLRKDISITIKKKETPTTWEHIEYLYEITRDVERERSKDKFKETVDHVYFDEFLKDEIATAKADAPTTT